MFNNSVPSGAYSGHVAQFLENDTINKLVDDTATLASGLARGTCAKYSAANSRWEICDGTVALEAIDVIGIVEYVGTPTTSGQVRVAGVYTDDDLSANTKYYCQADGSLGTTGTTVFVGRTTSAGRLVMAQGRAGGGGGVNYFGDESDGNKTFATSTYLGHYRITNYQRASNSVTISLNKAHSVQVGNWVSIQQCTAAALNCTAPPLTGAFTAGTHYYVVTAVGTYTVMFALTGTDIQSTAEVNGDATLCIWDGPAIVKNYSDLTINSGVTVIPAARCKGLVVYVKGNANIAGTLTMTARGASAAGVASDVAFWANNGIGVPVPNTYPLPAAGAAGAAAVPYSSGTGGVAPGITGTAGTNGQCGGGGSGAATNSTSGTATSGAGATGTSYSGGTGGGGSRWIAGVGGAVSGAANGGTGGSAVSSDSGGAGGGAGNPGGAGAANGTAGQNGTGGLIVVICSGDLTISGLVSADGCNGGTGTGGGGSGGGSINLFYAGNLTNTGTVRANGGAGGTGGPGGAGGAGTTRIIGIVA